jgi:putative DeoR family transcriptional regulator (stage III sporulation protein D)
MLRIYQRSFRIITAIHKDVTERLPLINEMIAARVRDILENNKAERHLRGGEATKKKYLAKKIK